MRRTRFRKLPPIMTWLEPVDSTTIAANALARERRPQRVWEGIHYTRRLATFQRAVFVILERRPGERIGEYRHRSELEAAERLKALCPFGARSLEFSGWWEANAEK